MKNIELLGDDIVNDVKKINYTSYLLGKNQLQKKFFSCNRYGNTRVPLRNHVKAIF